MKHLHRSSPARTACSIAVLAALGTLAQAQTSALPRSTLPVLRGVVSGEAVVRAPATTGSTRVLTIEQASQRAIIDWKSFNIGRDAEVRFVQPTSTASALNRIHDANPTVIQGRLTANGQILLINQNGILFDRGTQVNVQALVASALNVSNALFDSGAITTGGLATPAFQGGYDTAGNTLPARPDGSRPEAIVIGLGGDADAAAPSIRARQGGSIVIVAPRIDNRGGLISSPDGQVLLAAGGKAWLALADEDDTVLRGFRVEVEAPAEADLDLGSLVRNTGRIVADRGNVTLAALAINQEGRISASTAIQANGSIYLQARGRNPLEGAAAVAGTVTIAKGSSALVQPDAKDKATLPESESYATRRGLLQVDGGTIVSHGRLEATGGRVVLNAADAADPEAARIYLGDGSVTSAAGAWTELDGASHLATFRVTSNELKDSPDQKSGVLRGATVTVDLRKSNPALDLSGYRNARARSVSEKAAEGGEILVNSTGAVVLRDGATLDASGGGFRYSEAVLPTTKLLGDDGRIYDIGSAPKERSYVRLLDNYALTDERWGQTTTFNGVLGALAQREEASVEGRAGGSIAIGTAAGLVLDGRLKGGVTIGANQLDRAPRGASLTIGAIDGATGEFDDRQRIGSVTLVQQRSDTLGAAFGADTELTPEQRDGFRLAVEQIFGAAVRPDAQTIEQQGFGRVEINASGRIDVPAETALQADPGAALVLRAPQIDVAGTLSLPAGTLRLESKNAADPVFPGATLGTTLRSGAVLSTAGVWLNNAALDGSFVGDPLASAGLNADGTSTSFLNGGSITLAAAPESLTLLERGALVDVSGGAAIDRNRRVTGGNGGAIALTTVSSPLQTPDWLQAELRGHAVGTGGTLAINTPRAVVDAAGANGTLPANTTRLGPALFSTLGFSSVAISTSEGLVVTADADLKIEQHNLVVDPLASWALPTGGDLRSIAQVERLPDHLRGAANVSLAATGGLPDATLTMEQGARITTDPRGRIALRGDAGLAVDGTLIARGGAITLTQSTPTTAIDASALNVGPHARLSVAGSFIATPNADGLRTGNVVGAGTVTIAAANAGITLEDGATIDLRGTARTLDFVDNLGGGLPSSRRIVGNAGTLALRAQGEVQLDAKLDARKAGTSSAGGTFSLELNARDGQTAQPAPHRIVLTQAEPATTAPAIEQGAVEAALSVDTLRAAGFDKVRLQAESAVRFDASADLAFERGVRLDAPLIDVADGAQVRIAGANVTLANALGPRELAGVTWDRSQRAPSPALDTRAGTGVLRVEAGTIDLLGSVTLNGVSETLLAADGDIRLSGRAVETTQGGPVGRQVGSLTTAGSLTLSAAQVAPSTRSAFTLAVAEQPSGTQVPGGFILVQSNGSTPGDVYSAGGRLVLSADKIVQDGVLRAPQGEIDLRAGSLLELAPGSLTSVSGDGTVVPLGSTVSGQTWVYAEGASFNSQLDAPIGTGKRIELKGRTIDVRDGATVDLRGGGDVQAIEFVPGSGGSRNLLVQPNTYAIIPKASLSGAPVDADVASRQDIGTGPLAASPDATVYDSLVIGPGGAVPAGEYVLLPGRYAVLPDAYLVQLQTSTAYANLRPGETVQLANGQTVLPAVRSVAGTAIRESQAVGVIVRPGSVVSREADYRLSGSQFFADNASRDRTTPPRGPADAGRLVFGDATRLTLGGSFASDAAAGGRAAEIDLSAERIAVVTAAGRSDLDPAVLQVDAAGLSRLGGSVLIGGTRSDEGDATRITTGAREVLVANDAASVLRAGEVLVAATERIDVAAAAVIEGRGAGAATQRILSEPGGALLRASGAGIATVDRGVAVDTSRGEIAVAAGATLRAGGSLLLDATRDTTSAGRLEVDAGGALALASSRVSLGETAGISGGLVLSNADLQGLAQVDALTLRAYQSIDLVGRARIGSAALDALTLDTPTLRAVTAASGIRDAQVRADTVTLANTTGAAPLTNGGAGAGRLTVQAATIVADAGTKSIEGYGRVEMAATDALVGRSDGSLRVDADWSVATPRILAEAGSRQAWQAGSETAGRKAFNATATEGDAVAVRDVGGRIAVDAGRIGIDTQILARSGSVALTAHGSEGLTLGASARIDASGALRDFNGNRVVTDGGSVALRAADGAVTANAGSLVDVSAAPGGDAGSLTLRADTLSLAGSLRGAADGGDGGRADIDLGRLTGFGAVNAALAEGGFDAALALRLRSGNLSVAAGDTVKAREIRLSADAGRIDVAGTLDARSARGGATVELQAANGLALNGATLQADGNGSGASDGGRVVLATRGGTLAMDANSTIDVSASGRGRTGIVEFVVARDGANAAGASELRGTVRSGTHGVGGAAEVALVGERIATVADRLDGGTIAALQSEHEAFMAGDGAARLADLKGTMSRHLRGAVEVRAAGDLSLDEAFDLSTEGWLAGGEAGTLTLRAAGQLTVRSALGLPNDALREGATWNLRLVGGADLGAADALATVDATDGAPGVLLAGNNAKVRSGTGRIEIAAAGDFRMEGLQSVVTTQGRRQEGVVDNFGRWAVDGGDIAIRAGRDAVGGSDEWITEWLRRARGNEAIGAQWWTHRPNFQQGVGALGGGNVAITAGRDIDNLSAMLPTSGRLVVAEDETKTVDVQGGGNLSVRAGNELRGGSYLIARGEGRIAAGGSIGAVTPTQLHLQGASSGTAPRGATLALAAGNGIDLQSVSDPTTLFMTNSIGVGPSLGNGPSLISNFFSYSDNSRVEATAMGGDVTLGSELRIGRTLVPSQGALIGNVARLVAGAYPAQVKAASLQGDVSVRSESVLGFVTFPSEIGSLSLLAEGSVVNPRVIASDLRPDQVFDLDNPRFSFGVERFLTGSNLQAVGGAPRLVARTTVDGYAFDLQAVTGSVSTPEANPARVELPARSRIRAGTDVSNVELRLQNLDAADVSELRAVDGDVRAVGIEIRGPGRLLVQAGRDIDLGSSNIVQGSAQLGGIVATGNGSNPDLPVPDSARLTLVAGVRGDVDLKKLDASYARIIGVSSQEALVLELFRTLDGDPQRQDVLAAASVAGLAERDASYAPFIALAKKYPQLLATYQAALRDATLPLGVSADATLAGALYAKLNADPDTQRIVAAPAIADLGAGFAEFAALDAKYPRLFSDYKLRRNQGALPEGLRPIVYSDVLAGFVEAVAPGSGNGSISTFLSSIQTYGGSDIDLWAPGGGVVAGLTTPSAGATVGVLTNAGGAIRSVLRDDFDINQGKLITAQGGDIVVYSVSGSIDAGRGAKTSLSTPPPRRTPVLDPDTGVVIGYSYTLPAGASGSGIQTLSSDPDGLGPLVAPRAGNIYLVAPGGTIDAGEAGIRSGGNIVISAQTVLNASDIQAGGSSVGVPKVESGSFASSLATSSSSPPPSKAAEEAAAAAASAARAAAATPATRPSILSVEVLGFGDKNCKETDKDCFAK